MIAFLFYVQNRTNCRLKDLKIKTCSIEGCGKVAHARGLCHMHYRRLRIHGDALAVLKRSAGEGSIDGKGYLLFTINGRSHRAHTLVAEAALGRKMKQNEVVHHIDENRLNNSPDNLLICTRAYHVLIHRRMRAIKDSGNADFRKCPYCRKHDDKEKMYEAKRKNSSSFYHRECYNLNRQEQKNIT